MSKPVATVDPRWLRACSALLGAYAFVGALISFGGWALDMPRLSDWQNDGISIQPNTTVLLMLAGAAVLLLPSGYGRVVRMLGALIAIVGGLNLLQYIIDTDFGFNHQLLFGRPWGREGTVTPGRFGPPASVAFMLIGMSLVILSVPGHNARRYVPSMALVVILLTLFSLLGYLFGARNFYAIPWLSAIALQTGTMLMALALALIFRVPQHHPMLLLCERSSAGVMARTVLPALLVLIPMITWLRLKGLEYEFFDLGTSRALGAALQMLGTVSLMWIALLALRRRELLVREADQRKDEFLATLAHELRNPLAPISNAITLLNLADGNPELSARAMETIERQLMHMVRLVDDLLDLSRISSGKLELRRERMELTSVIRQAIETCDPLAQAAGQEISVSLPAQAIYMDGDPVRLSQVVSNLLNNACKFSEPGGRISLAAEQQDGELEIKVTDNGIGIPSDLLDAIFGMFSQVDQSLERSQGGLGIGLTLAMRLVKLHGGSIEAASDGLKKGATFTVRLPLAPDQTPPVEQPEQASQPLARHRILVVDDNIDSASSLAEVLKLMGNETFVAHDGLEAVDAAEKQRPDVILLDIGLPKLNGFDVCRRIRTFPWGQQIFILALTGWGQEEDRRKSRDAGFDGHLVKPVNMTEVANLLASRL